ncbi:hypothetical protein CCANI_04085 [Corynebacterium canis]|nr:hypothetical protein CCANI_04085 [Corynebacterium canis]
MKDLPQAHLHTMNSRYEAAFHAELFRIVPDVLDFDGEAEATVGGDYVIRCQTLRYMWCRTTTRAVFTQTSP